MQQSFYVDKEHLLLKQYILPFLFIQLWNIKNTYDFQSGKVYQTLHKYLKSIYLFI